MNLLYGNKGFRMTTIWQCGSHQFDLSKRPYIMGILNVTPDSFSDGGLHNGVTQAVEHARRMIAQGADVIDVGGESTRPGFDENGVTLEEERRRVIPVVRALCQEGFVVSVDTSKPEIMQEVARLGAAILNDIRGFRRPHAVRTAAATQCGLIVMHRKSRPVYRDVVQRVQAYLRARQELLQAHGVAGNRIMWDPGFGFGKTPEQNFALLRATPRFVAQGQPYMMALSRKSSLAIMTRRMPPRERIAASVAGALFAIDRGAHFVRVHDCQETWDAIQIWRAARGF